MATKSKTTKRSNKRQSIPRTTRKFQLRKNHVIDEHVADILDYARSQRKEVTMIRDGVRLLWALQNNDIDVLFEMFPHLKPRVATTSNSGGGHSELAKEIAEQIILLNGTPGYLMQSAPALPAPTMLQTTTGKVLGGFKPLAAPVEDDDDLPEIQTQVQSRSAMDNFISMMSSLNN